MTTFKIITFTADEVNSHSYEVNGVLKLVPHNGPKVAEKTAYSGLLREKFFAIIGDQDAIDFKVNDGFKPTSSTKEKWACYPVCTHGRKHSVHYKSANFRRDAELRLKWNVKCEECVNIIDAPNVTQNVPVIEVPAPDIPLNTPSARNFFSAVRDQVGEKLDALEQDLLQHPDPLQALADNQAGLSLGVAQAFLLGVTAARVAAIIVPPVTAEVFELIEEQQPPIHQPLDDVLVLNLTEREVLEMEDDQMQPPPSPPKTPTPLEEAEHQVILAATAAMLPRTKRVRQLSIAGAAAIENAKAKKGKKGGKK